MLYQKLENYQELVNCNLIRKYKYADIQNNDDNNNYNKNSSDSPNIKFDDNVKEIEYHFFASNNFENKVTQFFEDFKQLIKLPSYLFALKFKSKKIKIKI